MSTVIAKNVQIGTSGTATDNFTIFQPVTPDGTLRIGNGNTGVTTSQVALTSAGLFQFNSGYGSAATAYGCRAWVNFNGTGTVAIRASGNVSSITDNGVGTYTVNFTTAMPDANYSLVFGFQRPSATSYMDYLSGSKLAGSAVVRIQDTTGTSQDSSDLSVSIFR